ncbi:hypothetical protein FACS1894132_00630 [Clostridia bacterium]|nr:hypothetical protein FACS1894132_00630 [Clostridia bacterium]
MYSPEKIAEQSRTDYRKGLFKASSKTLSFDTIDAEISALKIPFERIEYFNNLTDENKNYYSSRFYI